ncbi:MAG: D-alanyl-D-alanine carboxypeptidase [Syntrophorhabdaceae bacterium]|nr:D-alanyl-D-alanine carboxypeptidase [Syntrophorhabdaceae bacterium]
MTRLLLILFFLFPSMLFAGETITANSYILVEKESFEIIAGRNYHTKLAPASTTKVMTTLLAIETVDTGETIIPDKKVARLPASKMHLVPGREYSAIDLMNGAMIESANDAAYALAKHIGGSEEDFARMMNERANELGALNTNFKNASGLYVNGQYTTCYDLALIFKYALSNDIFRELITKKYFFFQDSRKSVRYKNHNRFLFCFEPAIGGKTGFTRKSKHCYVGAFERDGRTYILSLLNSRDLWGDAVLILGNLYDQLPSDKELRSARAPSASLSSYKQKKATKKVSAKKKYKKKVKRVSKKPVKSGS